MTDRIWQLAYFDNQLFKYDLAGLMVAGYKSDYNKLNISEYDL